MTEMPIGYARVPTDAHDLTGRRDAVAALGVSAERMHVDHERSGTKPDRSVFGRKPVSPSWIPRSMMGLKERR